MRYEVSLRYQDVADRIRLLVEKKALWNSYLTPERKLAKKFSVSRETVRRGLDLLEKQGIVSRSQGRGTLVLPRAATRKKKGTARVVVATHQQLGVAGHSGDTIAGMADESAKAEWLISFANLTSPTTRQQFFSRLAGGDVDGVLLHAVTDRQLVEEVLRLWGGPVVLVDHSYEDMPVTSVRDDSEGGARQAMLHILSLGHRRIGYVEISSRELNPWRYAGYADTLRDSGIELDERLVVPAFSSFDAGRRAGDQILAIDSPPTAVLAFDDLRAWGVWRAAEAAGLEVGRDFALVGFGDAAAQSGFPEELTSIRFDSTRIGRLAVEKLGELMSGKARPGELVLAPTELVVRKSSREARAGIRKQLPSSASSRPSPSVSGA